MSKLNPEKLSVEYRDGVNYVRPVVGRKYTLTHSDDTGELFLTIGQTYAYEKITEMRDEVLAEWRVFNGRELYLFVYVYVGDYGPVVNKKRDEIFRKELPLALEAILFGDRQFLWSHYDLTNAAVCIHFDSKDKKYNQFEYWGKVKDYLITV